MWILYDFAFLLFSIVYLPYMLFTGRWHADFIQRFGILPRELKGNRDSVWIHAVSVGEVIAAKAFVQSLKAAFPDKKIILSTTTKTGQEVAKKTFGHHVMTFYFPVDLRIVASKVVNLVLPAFFVVFETELWPNVIAELKRKGIPVFLVNGRISDRSYGGYKFISLAIRPVLKNMNSLCMQTEEDARRIISIGAPVKKVRVVGNLKYDTGHASDSSLLGPVIDKAEFGLAPDDDLLICGSTHPGEEEILLKVYRDLKKIFSNLRLMLAPRHIDRALEIKALCARNAFPSINVSEIPKDAVAVKDDKTVLVLDTMGQLGRIYSVASVVFVGGSLMPRGGHNLIEPARYSKAIVFGPHMENFREMAKRFLKAEAAVMVHNQAELKSAISSLLEDKLKRNSIGMRAAKFVYENKGAVNRTIEIIKEALPRV